MFESIDESTLRTVFAPLQLHDKGNVILFSFTLCLVHKSLPPEVIEKTEKTHQKHNNTRPISFSFQIESWHGKKHFGGNRVTREQSRFEGLRSRCADLEQKKYLTYLEPLFQSESSSETFHMKISMILHENELEEGTHFRLKVFA